MVEQTWNGSEAARVLGATYWQLREWDRSGLLQPSRRMGTGPRPRKGYVFRDLLAARTMLALRKAGVSGQRVRKAVRELQSKDVVARSRLVVIGAGRRTDVLLVEDAEMLRSLVTTPGQLVVRSFVVVEVGAEAAALRRRIAEVEAAAA